jgi:hypothetical protein
MIETKHKTHHTIPQKQKEPKTPNITEEYKPLMLIDYHIKVHMIGFKTFLYPNVVGFDSLKISNLNSLSFKNQILDILCLFFFIKII